MPVSRTELPIQILTGTLAGTVVAQRFVSGYMGALTQTGAAAAACGVAQVAGVSGDLIPYACDGVVLVECGAAIAAGAQLDVDASGRAITHAAGVIVGTAQNATTALGQYVQVKLRCTL
jgi:hypothetical protein